MRNFNFCAPTKIMFGKNKVAEIGSEIKSFGSRVLLVYGGGSIKSSGLYSQVTEILKKENLFFVELSGVQPNPRITSVRDGVRLCREHQLDFILAVGGGSVIDCSKGISAGVFYDGDVWDFTIQKAKIRKVLPIGTVLTLAATGTEMNGNAVISNEDEADKRALSSDLLRPKFSVLDPSLTFSVNKWQTAAGTADIMSHIFEQYFTLDKGTFIQDAIAEAILKTCIQYGIRAIENPEDYEARANLMWASSLALNGLTSTSKPEGDWSTHQMEHQLSAVNDMTHGAGLAILFPVWMKYVLNSETSSKLAQMARNVWGIVEEDDTKAALLGIDKVRAFFSSMGLPSTLSESGITQEHIPQMVQKVCLFGPIGGFFKLNSVDVKNIYEMAL